jgi:hypothetical protein
VRQEEKLMSKFKIEHGASKIRLVLLKTNIEDNISHDIELMCQWSDNERKYIINELLRFALTQEEEFLKYKASLPVNSSRPTGVLRGSPAPSKAGPDSVRKPEATATNTTAHT